jgi:hypothetical protein
MQVIVVAVAVIPIMASQLYLCSAQGIYYYQRN